MKKGDEPIHDYTKRFTRVLGLLDDVCFSEQGKVNYYMKGLLEESFQDAGEAPHWLMQ